MPRQHRSLINEILDSNANNCTNNNQIDNVFFKHFEDIYNEPGHEIWFVDNLD